MRAFLLGEEDADEGGPSLRAELGGELLGEFVLSVVGFLNPKER